MWMLVGVGGLLILICLLVSVFCVIRSKCKKSRIDSEGGESMDHVANAIEFGTVVKEADAMSRDVQSPGSIIPPSLAMVGFTPKKKKRHSKKGGSTDAANTSFSPLPGGEDVDENETVNDINLEESKTMTVTTLTSREGGVGGIKPSGINVQATIFENDAIYTPSTRVKGAASVKEEDNVNSPFTPLMTDMGGNRQDRAVSLEQTMTLGGHIVQADDSDSD